MRRTGYKALIGLAMLAGCVKDKPDTQRTVVPTEKSGVYVVCEGQFTAGNGSLYLYKPVKDSVYGDLYSAANGQPLGDVFQSMRMIDNRLFLAVNNSDKVVVVNAGDIQTAGVIGIPSPRYILPVGPDKAYVSSLYHNKVYVINTASLQLVDSIQVSSQNTEGMLLYNGDAYVCAWDTASRNIYKINTTTNTVAQTIQVAGVAPHDILVDKEQMLWVLSGNQPRGKQAYWTRIDPSTGAILKTYAFPPTAEPIKPVLNTTKDTLYFIEVNYNGGTADNGIYRMAIHAADLPVVPFITAQQYQYFWSVGVDPVTGYIYAGDPKGFNQKGSVNVYRPDGVKVSSFGVGVGPGMFLFVE